MHSYVLGDMPSFDQDVEFVLHMLCLDVILIQVELVLVNGYKQTDQVP